MYRMKNKRPTVNQIAIFRWRRQIVLLILAKASICQARFLRLANVSAAKTRATRSVAYIWQMITLRGINTVII